MNYDILHTKHLLCVPSFQEGQEFRGNHGHPVEHIRMKTHTYEQAFTLYYMVQKVWKNILRCLVFRKRPYLRSRGSSITRFSRSAIVTLEKIIKQDVKIQFGQSTCISRLKQTTTLYLHLHHFCQEDQEGHEHLRVPVMKIKKNSVLQFKGH